MRRAFPVYPTALAAFNGVLGQVQPEPKTSYQEAFDAAFDTCVNLLSEEECRRMLGYIPFVCPPPAQKPLYTHPLFWLGAGLIAGKVFF